MDFIKINEKEYKAKDFDFNTVCDLEDMGVSLIEMAHKPMGMIRSYIAVCMGVSKESAGEELQAHMLAGGTLNEANEIMAKKLNDSDFFRAINQTAEKKDSASKSKETKKK